MYVHMCYLYMHLYLDANQYVEYVTFLLKITIFLSM